MTARYHSPSDLPSEIPVFPLRGAILLPRAHIPLNIFEPRYLAMIDHALATDRVIGIIQPRSTGRADAGAAAGTEESPHNNAPLRTIGGAGRISSFQETDDGRYMIGITGISRFSIVSELETSTPFRQCSVDFSAFADDLRDGLGEDEVDRAKLLRVLRAYLDANSFEADWEAINASTSEFLINTLSVISPYGPEEKQALLEADGLAARAHVLITLAEMELASPDDGSGSTIQ